MSASRFSKQNETGFRRAHFGDRRGDGARQRGAAGDRGLHRGAAGRHRIDEIGVDKKRRERKHGRRDLRLVAGKGEYDGRRRARTRRQRVGERPAHQRRRIVEQHQHRAFGGGEIVGGEIGIKVGARQRAGRFGPLAGRRGAHPLKKMADDHRSLTQHRFFWPIPILAART